MSSLPLTPQEKAIYSRYGNNNFSFDAFNRGASLPIVEGSSFGFTSGPVPYRHQDILSGKKQQLAGDYRTMAIDYRNNLSRAASHAPLNYTTPFMGQPN